MQRRMFLIGSLAVLVGFVSGWFARPVSGENDEQKTMVYELRTYTTNPGKLPELHNRFRDHTIALFKRHGMKNVIYTTPTDKKRKENTLVYLVAHKSRTAADASWKAFVSDPEWKKAYAASIEDGKLVKKITRQYLKPTKYSPMK